MKKTLLFVLYIALAFHADRSYAVDTAKIRKYYELTNKAELAIIDSNYSEATGLYKKAFTMKEGNGTDLFNAFIVSFLTKDTQNARLCFRELTLHGMKLSVLENSKFGEKISKDQLFQLVTSDYDSLREVCLKSDKPRLASILDSIYDNDQRARQNSKEMHVSYEDIDNANVDNICNFVQKYGFPSFEKVGVLEKRTITVGNFGAFSLVMWHVRGRKTRLSTIAHNAVIAGEYPPNEYALISDMRDPKYYMILPEHLDMIAPTNSSTKETNMDENVINQNRYSIYLESLHDYRRKLDFLKTDNRFIMEPVFALMFNNGKIERKK